MSREFQGTDDVLCREVSTVHRDLTGYLLYVQRGLDVVDVNRFRQLPQADRARVGATDRDLSCNLSQLQIRVAALQLHCPSDVCAADHIASAGIDLHVSAEVL